MIAGITTLELLRQIILGYIPTFDETRINIYNQKFKIPDDDGVFVTIEYNSGKVLSSRSNFNFSGNNPESVDLNTLENISIDIMSRNTDALRTKELFVMALNSYFSQGIQEKNGFKILRIAPINNLSDLEGSARLFRYEIPVNIFAWYENLTPADYFNIFNFQVIANGDPEMKTPVIAQPTIQPIL